MLLYTLLYSSGDMFRGNNQRRRNRTPGTHLPHHSHAPHLYGRNTSTLYSSATHIPLVAGAPTLRLVHHPASPISLPAWHNVHEFHETLPTQTGPCLDVPPLSSRPI